MTHYYNNADEPTRNAVPDTSNGCVDQDRVTVTRKCGAGVMWITNNLDHFIPWEEWILTDTRVKAFAELAILYGHLKQREETLRYHIQDLPAHLLLWRDFFLQHCEHRGYAEMARKRPPQSIYLLLPYLVLRAFGYRFPYHEETLSRVKRYGYPAACEVVPYRVLDYKFYLWKSGFLTREPSWYKLYCDTTLARSRNLVYIDKDAAYSITHTIFYLTDFGNRPALLQATELRRVIDVVECLLIHYWRLAHWDLVGELLICLNSLGERNSALYAGAIKAFRRAWRDDGTVPASRDEAYKVSMAKVPKQCTLRFSTYYHTTLVALLFGTTFLY